MARVTVELPGPLRSLAGGRERVEVEAATVEEAMDRLVEEHPGLRGHLYADDGRLRSSVNLYLGDRDVRGLEGSDRELRDGDELTIVASISGG